MSELQRRRDAVSAQASKFDRESEFLLMQMERLETSLETPDADSVALLLSQSKRVRREAVDLVRCIAQLRDHLQPTEAQGNE